MYQLWEERASSSCGTEQETRAGCDWKGALHLGPALSVYMSPFTCPSAVIRRGGKKHRVASGDQETEGRGELVFFGSETMANGPKRQTVLGMKE